MNERSVLCSKPSKKSCRLRWGPDRFFNANKENKKYGILFYSFYYGILFLLFLLSIQTLSKIDTKYGVLFLVVTWSIAMIYAQYNKAKNEDYSDIFGSVWCFMAVFYPLVIIMTK
jgi:hypothetical protein